VSVRSLFEPERLDLADLVSALLDKGVVLRGEVDISVADIDLLRLDLGALLAAVETEVRRQRSRTASLAGTLGPPALTPDGGPPLRGRAESVAAGYVAPDVRAVGEARRGGGEVEVELQEVAPSLPERVNVDPDGVENGLARLVLTLIEVLRKVLEHQAIRRMEGGSLSGEEIERLGLGLLRLHDQMNELKAVFGLTDDDLQIDLGPLGRVR
jgi:hypothetical protein